MSTPTRNASLAFKYQHVARVYAATSAIAKVFPETARALTARLNVAAVDPLELANEAESVQATLILGSAATAKGNHIPEENLHSLRPSFAKDMTGAAKLLRDQRGLAEVSA